MSGSIWGSPYLEELPYILIVINPLRKPDAPPQPHEGARTLGRAASKASVSASCIGVEFALWVLTFGLMTGSCTRYGVGVWNRSRCRVQVLVSIGFLSTWALTLGVLQSCKVPVLGASSSSIHMG